MFISLFDIFLSKIYRIEIILMSLIIVLGIINVYLSDNIYQSSIWMTMFLLSGIIPLWTSMFVITDDRSRNNLYYLSCVLLFVITILEIANYFITGRDLLSMNHPIPLGTLVILLMVGPLFMLLSGQKRMKLFSIFLVIMGLILVIIANKRGIYLAIAGMTAAWI